MEKQVQQVTPSVSVREIGIITSEINDLCRHAQSMALMYAVEIGRRLTEAKDVLPHGEWGNWLKNEVEFSQRSANNFMKLFKEYGSSQFSFFSFDSNSQTFANLSYTKALALLSVPEEERKEFAEEVKADEISLQELQNAIEGRKEAEKEMLEAKKREEELSQKLASAEIAKAAAEKKAIEVDKNREEIERLEADLKKKRENEKKLREKLKLVENNPKISQELLTKLKEEAIAEVKAIQDADIKKEIEKGIAEVVANSEELQKQLEEAKASQKAAEEAKLQAEANAKEAADKFIEAQRKVKMASPMVTEFKVLFDQVQKIVNEMRLKIENIKAENPDVADKLSAALKAFGSSLLTEN